MLAPISPVVFAIVAILQAANARVLHGGLDVDLDQDQNLNLDLNLDLSLDKNQNMNLDLDLDLKVGLSQNQTIDEKPQEKPQTIDEVIAAAFHGDVGREERKDGMVRTEMDMWLTEEQYQALHGDPTTRQKRKAHSDPTRRWTDGKVWYRFAPGHFNGDQYKEIMAGMAEWEKRTCLTFHHDSLQTQDMFIYIQDGGECSSWVGMVKKGSHGANPHGGQNLTLSTGPWSWDSCFGKKGGTIVHEFGHAIGFYHEHKRPDRDSYITINESNIDPLEKYNFYKVKEDKINTYGVPYDLNSIMHYGIRSGSINGNPTIKVNESLNYNESKLGTSYQLSFYDAMLANKMYKCDKGCTNTCPRGAYRGKDCTCYCQGPDPMDDPIRECKRTGTTRPVTQRPTNQSCRDITTRCRLFDLSLICKNPRYAKWCAKSCGKC